MQIEFLKVRNVKLPERGTKLSSGIDFFIPNGIHNIIDSIKFTPINDETLQKKLFDKCLDIDNGKITIPVGVGVLIPSGLKVILPKHIDETKTYEMVIYNKSGIAVKNNLLIGAQVIDNDYRGEFNIHLINCGNKDIVLEVGQKIAQGIVREVELCKIKEIALEYFYANSETERGEGGFGSTGK